jgi:hypothetical protein
MPSSEAVCPNHASQKAVLPHRMQYCPNPAPVMPHRRQSAPIMPHRRQSALIMPQSCLTGGSLPQSCLLTLPKSCPSTACFRKLWLNIRVKYVIVGDKNLLSSPSLHPRLLVCRVLRQVEISVSGDSAAGLMLFAWHSDRAKFAIWCHKFVAFWLVESASTIHCRPYLVKGLGKSHLWSG